LPDQASAHYDHFAYGKEVIDWLNSKKIEFVPKYLNPANAPVKSKIFGVFQKAKFMLKISLQKANPFNLEEK